MFDLIKTLKIFIQVFIGYQGSCMWPKYDSFIGRTRMNNYWIWEGYIKAWHFLKDEEPVSREDQVAPFQICNSSWDKLFEML